MEDASDTAKIFAQTRFNGDGIIVAESPSDEPTQAVIADIIACLGADNDLSGKPGVSQVRVDQFSAELTAYSDWHTRAETEFGAPASQTVHRNDRGVRKPGFNPIFSGSAAFTIRAGPLLRNGSKGGTVSASEPDCRVMPRETNAAKATRLRRIIAGLKRAYPEAHCELNHTNPLELLVATILSAQCNDKQVNLVTTALFQKYRTAAGYANADPAGLERDIRRLGLYRNKAKSIRAACRKLVERGGGEVPRTMDELTQLDGVGRKTANVVLGNAFGLNVGMVVDTHVARLSSRLGLTTEEKPEKVEQELMKLVPRAEWTKFSHWLIWHGRRRCAARKPDCAGCEIAKLCPSAGKV